MTLLWLVGTFLGVYCTKQIPSRCADVACHDNAGASCSESLQPYAYNLCFFPGLACSGVIPNASQGPTLPPLPDPLPDPPTCIGSSHQCQAAQPGVTKCGCDRDCTHPSLLLSCQNGVCVVEKLPGDACKVQKDCPNTGQFCMSGRCGPGTLPGNICIRQSDCLADSFCNDTAVLDQRPPQCQKRPRIGEQCSPLLPCYFPQAACNLALEKPVCQPVFSLKQGEAVMQFPSGPPSLCASGFVHELTCQDWPQASNPYAPCSVNAMCITNYKGPGPPVFGSCECSADPSNNLPVCSPFPTNTPQSLVASASVVSGLQALINCAVLNKCWLNDIWKTTHTTGSCVLTNCKSLASSYLCAYATELYLLCVSHPSASRQYCSCVDTTAIAMAECGFVPSFSPSPSHSLSPAPPGFASPSPGSSPAGAGGSTSTLWQDYGNYFAIAAAATTGSALLVVGYFCCCRRRPDFTDQDEYWPTPAEERLDRSAALLRQMDSKDSGSRPTAPDKEGEDERYSYGGNGPPLYAGDPDGPLLSEGEFVTGNSQPRIGSMGTQQGSLLSDED
eukprot:gb/GEZN01004641.1/.p1 GENE.gb/GEZN01004641.1/~~gb/GEZN01004641.1/.p1  ORF type:complete len:559 (+),score=53.67 gb/GEZN01004641.1/:92-1768(+)